MTASVAAEDNQFCELQEDITEHEYEDNIEENYQSVDGHETENQSDSYVFYNDPNDNEDEYEEIDEQTTSKIDNLLKSDFARVRKLSICITLI